MQILPECFDPSFFWLWHLCQTSPMRVRGIPFADLTEMRNIIKIQPKWIGRGMVFFYYQVIYVQNFREGIWYSTELQAINTLVSFKLLIVHSSDCSCCNFNNPWLGWERCNSESRYKKYSMNSCMWMSSRALLSLCRVQLGERQTRAMMSPPLANKLGLTLWGPWRKGKGIEWECAVAMLQDNIHGRWEAMVMLGEGGGEASWNLRKGEGQMTPTTGIAVKEEKSYSNSNVKLTWHPQFHQWPALQ